MSTGARGPSGIAAGPPDWLAQTGLPFTSYAAGAPFVRIHRIGRPAAFFSPGSGPPLGRFDSAAGLFGTLYAAENLAGAVAETLLRNPARRLVGMADLTTRAVAVLTTSRPVRLAALHGPGLLALGLDNAITTGPYAPCGAWADALFSHADRPDGIAYASRHDPGQICVALFSRPHITVSVAGDSIPLADMPQEIGRILRRYRKGLVR